MPLWGILGVAFPEPQQTLAQLGPRTRNENDSGIPLIIFIETDILF